MNAFLPSPGAKRQMRIFVVENHEDTRFLLCLLLELVRLDEAADATDPLAGRQRREG